jgi:hypothetical protein
MSLLPKKKMPMVFSTAQALEYTGLSYHTFRRYRDLLEILPRKMYGVRGRYYLLHELIEILNMRVPDVKSYRAHVLDRLAVQKRKKA